MNPLPCVHEYDAVTGTRPHMPPTAPVLGQRSYRASLDERWPAEDIEDDDELVKSFMPLIPRQPASLPAPPEHDGGTLRALVFGGINSLVGLPALIAFATIVFQARNKGSGARVTVTVDLR